MVWAFEKASGTSIPFKIAERRPGDVAACYADPGQALILLGWRAERDLEAMCRDAWRWQCGNPNGYVVQEQPVLEASDVSAAAKKQ